MATKKPAKKSPTEPGRAAVTKGQVSMSDYQAAFAKGRERAIEFKGGVDVQLENGNYVCQLTAASTNFTLDKKGNPVTKEGKRPGFRMGFVVLKGEHKGKQPSTWNGLENEVSISILIQQLSLLFNCEPDDITLSALPDLAQQLADDKPFVRLQAKNNTVKAGKRAGETLTNYIVRAVLEDQNDEAEE